MESKDQDIVVLDKSDVTNTIQNVKKEDIRRYWDKDRINEVIESIRNTKDRVLTMVLWMTGLRVSEINYLRKCDIDFKNKVMTVRHLKSRRFNERIVPIKSELCNLLQLYTAPMGWDEPLFGLTRQSVFRIIKKYFNESPHFLRHSFAVNFLRQSQNPTAIVILQRLLGHSKINTTMEYLKIVPFDMAIELEKVRFN